VSDQELDKKATLIQKTWRGYLIRKKLRRRNEAMAKFHQKYRQRKQMEEDKKQKLAVEQELRFQLLLEHRRKQRQRNVDMLELLEILPANQIDKYYEKQRDYSATVIQAWYRGCKTRQLMKTVKKDAKEIKAAICIQRAVCLIFYST
jgi:hypothetical protein